MSKKGPGMKKTLRLHLHFSDEDKMAVQNSIKLYRAVAAKASAVLECALAGGSTIEEKPRKNESGEVETDIFVRSSRSEAEPAQQILQAVFDKKGKAFGYPCRDWIVQSLGDLRSCVADAMIRELGSRWKAEDPDPKVKGRRDWLVLNGRRFRPAMMRALLPIRRTMYEIDGHRLTLRVYKDREVEARLGDLDPGRWAILRRFADGRATCGDMKLGRDRKNRFFAIVPYEITEQEDQSLDANRTAEVSFVDGSIVMCMCEGEASRVDTMRTYSISVRPALDRAARLGSMGDELETDLKACGTRRNGNQRARSHYQKRMARITLAKEANKTNYNHFWTRTIVEKCRQWNCGSVELHLPDSLFGDSWPFAKFRFFMAYKAGEAGIAIRELEAMRGTA
jgi:hypothetical protein